jgi:hypothetical protein
LIGRLLGFVDAKVGEGNTLVALTADHGVAPLPEMLEQWKMPGGRLPSKAVLDAIEGALKKKFGGGRWVAGGSGAAPYFNRELIRARKLKDADVQRVAAEAAAAVPHVFRVYTREELLNGAAPGDPITQRVVNGFFPSRSSHLGGGLLDPIRARSEPRLRVRLRLARPGDLHGAERTGRQIRQAHSAE